MKKAAPKTKERACRICGCTENNACITAAGPCSWVQADLCSNPDCIKRVERRGGKKRKLPPTAVAKLSVTDIRTLERGARHRNGVIDFWGDGSGFGKRNHDARMVRFVTLGLATPNAHGDHYITDAGRAELLKGYDNGR
jgi:hypothetical protein